jgi:hypothetical protein
MNTVISEFWNEGRKAVIRKEKEGFEVDLYKEDYKETRQVHNHSESYAEDVAENFVFGLFDIEKEGSFYGYNERDDNFYPEIDD